MWRYCHINAKQYFLFNEEIRSKHKEWGGGVRDAKKTDNRRGGVVKC